MLTLVIVAVGAMTTVGPFNSMQACQEAADAINYTMSKADIMAFCVEVR